MLESLVMTAYTAAFIALITDLLLMTVFLLLLSYRLYGRSFDE